MIADRVAIDPRLAVEEVHDADELFTTGNLGKVLPITKVAERDLQPGPIYRKAREIYWDWALG